MKDERIQSTINRFAAAGFFIWYVLTLISLNYRLLILKQHPREFWDFFTIFLIANIFVFIAYANKGVLDFGFRKRWFIICVSIIIGVLVISFITGRLDSAADILGTFLGLLLGLALVIGVSYMLNQHWKRKEGIEDE